jgi:hypothetical protein
VSTEQVSLNPRRFSEDHLQLIFEMHRNLADQLHNQSILNHRMDLLFDSLSSEPAQRRCLTCFQPFVFTYNHDGCRVRHTSSFLSIMFSGLDRNQLQSIFVFVKTLVLGYSHVSKFCRPPVLVSMHVAEQVADFDQCIDMKTL